MAVYWVTEALPLAATALLPVLVFPLLGVMKASELSSNYIKVYTMSFFERFIYFSTILILYKGKRIYIHVIFL